MTESFSARKHMQDLVDKGWMRSTSQPNVIYHPQDYSLRVRYNQLTDTLSISPELEQRIDLIILTKPSQSKVFKR